MTAKAVAGARRRRLSLIAAFAIGEALLAVPLMGPLLGLPWWRGFRGYFSYDQLAYAAIATNVAHGDLSLNEPYTQTGTSYYPSAWYLTIGLVARLTGLPVHVCWTVLGILLVSLAVGGVGWLAYRMSNRAWAPVVPPLALMTGTLAVPTVGNWYAPLGAHAVLWGPYGTLFPLNAEVAGLSLTAIAVTLLALASRDPSMPMRRRGTLVVTAAFLAGLIANVHTYAFFTALALTAAFVASRCLLVNRSRPRTLLTLGLLATTLILGPAISAVVGPLPLFGVVLLSLTPAVLPLARQHVGLTTAALAALGVACAPQVLRTGWGLAQEDPFLTYRQASTNGLGVLSWHTLVASLTLLLLFSACAVAVWRGRQATQTSLVIALAACFTILPLNDLWGFNQEPYRFWLQFQVLSLLLLSAVLAWGLTTVPTMAVVRRWSFVALTAVVLGLWIAGLADVRAFWAFARDSGIVTMDDARLVAAQSLLNGKPGIVMSSRCTTPGILKNATGQQVAAYNRGLAWPPDVQAFEIFTDPQRRAGEDPVALAAADVTYVLTDSACSDDWVFPADQRVVRVTTREYTEDSRLQSLTLWRVMPA
jgi:hypothetical protein